MSQYKMVTYNGMKCRLYKDYMAEGDGPLVRIENSMDIDKAYEMGFTCVGYPDEVAKYITNEEYEELLKQIEKKEQKKRLKDILKKILSSLITKGLIIILAVVCTFGCSVKKNKYYETYEKYIDNLKSSKELDYESLNLYFNEDIGDDYFFQGFKGKFDTSEIIKETDEYLIAKVVFEIENPAKTALNVGKNEKYICVTKVRINQEYYDSGDLKTHDVKDEYGVVYIENPEEVELKYEHFSDTEDWHDFLKCDCIYNRGFGFKNEEDRYAIIAFFDEEINVDLDQDGSSDSLSFELKEGQHDDGDIYYYYEMYVNKGTDNEAVYSPDVLRSRERDRLEDETYNVLDVDGDDGYLDIMFNNAIKDKSYSFIYDGKEITEKCEVDGYLYPEFRDDGYVVVTKRRNEND